LRIAPDGKILPRQQDGKILPRQIARFVKTNACHAYNKYMLFTGCEVRTEKYFPEVSEAAEGREDASEAEGKYFLVRTDLNGK
jgi:hypothetical protein